jgi:hypothetical protein
MGSAESNDDRIHEVRKQIIVQQAKVIVLKIAGREVTVRKSRYANNVHPLVLARA